LCFVAALFVLLSIVSCDSSDGGEHGVNDDVADDDTDDDTDDDCTPPWEDGEDLGPADPMLPGDQGFDENERETVELAMNVLMEQQSVYFAATYDQANELYIVRSKRGDVSFRRVIGEDGYEFEIASSNGDDPFPNRDLGHLSTYEDELAAGSNPMNTSYPDYGYEEGDERLSFIEPEDNGYPLPLLRISQLFDSPNAPDLVHCAMPYGHGSIGTHGNLDVIQSRAALIFSGAGVKSGYVSRVDANSVDIAPTVMAVLGGQTTTGIDSRGRIYTANMIGWQDGRVIEDALEDPCNGGGADYAVIVLFDGLNSNEIIHAYQTGEPYLPNIFFLMETGTIMGKGAVVGYPSVSIPGHISVGTGAYQGHHGFVNNSVYDREAELLFGPDYVINHIEDFIQDPSLLFDLYYHFYNEDVETIFEAVHRSFGEEAFTASINELTVEGADYTPLDILPQFEEKALGAKGGKGLDEYMMADQFAVIQLKRIFKQHGPPKLVYLSFYSSDGAGEASGPHGDLLRETMTYLDSLTGEIVNQYVQAGVFDKTVFVLTSDHGMEIQDKNRAFDWGGPLRSAGLKYVGSASFQFLYLFTMAIDLSTTDFTAGVPVDLEIAVTDDDTCEPVVDAEVELAAGECQPCVETTNDSGVVNFSFVPSSGEDVELTVTHPSYNTAHRTYPVSER